MKVTQEPNDFKPVTITLETYAEVNDLLEGLRLIDLTTSPRGIDYTILTLINNLTAL